MQVFIYLSKTKLKNEFKRKPGGAREISSAEIGPTSLKATFDPRVPADENAEENVNLYNAITYLKRQAFDIHDPAVKCWDWIWFRMDMGYGTSYRDTGLPPVADDVALFYGSTIYDASISTPAVDLLLCGSTHHLTTSTKSEGRMGSGTEWLDDLIHEIDKRDSSGITARPDSLAPEAVNTPRVNPIPQVARWAFDVLAEHHDPSQRGRLQGFARVLVAVPATEASPRLIVASPLFVQPASAAPSSGLAARRRIHRDLKRRYGRDKWSPDLPPEDRKRVFIPGKSPMPLERSQ